ncbi:hypothetical protein Ocin01_18576 [Orchesella cincta]|nr:hypothetical protein Ocin01_18576 [Orchesella cincta]
MPLDVLCYHSAVLMEWSKKLRYPVKIRSDMELVTQTDTNRNTICECKPAPRQTKMVRDKREL